MKNQTYEIELLSQKEEDCSQSLSLQSEQTCTTTNNANLPIPSQARSQARPTRYHLQHNLVRATATTTSKSSARKHHLQQAAQFPHQQQRHPFYLQRAKVIRASEYKNLRKAVPSLRRQRDVGKVEVVTEAARYIDHLHKTLIERFVLCGIPNSLKDILGTDDAKELNSQHIMNLVTQMAATQRQQPLTSAPQTRVNSQVRARRCSSRNIVPKRPRLSHRFGGLAATAQQVSRINANQATLFLSARNANSQPNIGSSSRKPLPVVVVKRNDSMDSDWEEDESEEADNNSTGAHRS